MGMSQLEGVMRDKVTWGSIALLTLLLAYVIKVELSSSRGFPEISPADVGTWQDGNDVPAPDFSLATLEGDTLRLSDLRGQIVVLNFWATWCAPCRKETPAFVELHQEFEEQGVQFIGVSVDEFSADVRSFVEEFGVTYPIGIDDGRVQPRYKEITGYPTTYLINRRGQIEQYMPGALSREALRPVLEQMLQRSAA